VPTNKLNTVTITTNICNNNNVSANESNTLSIKSHSLITKTIHEEIHVNNTCNELLMTSNINVDIVAIKDSLRCPENVWSVSTDLFFNRLIKVTSKLLLLSSKQCMKEYAFRNDIHALEHCYITIEKMALARCSLLINCPIGLEEMICESHITAQTVNETISINALLCPPLIETGKSFSIKNAPGNCS
jgi:hypothetical protein